MRSSPCLGCLLAAILSACGQEPTTGPQMHAYLEAVELQNSGSLESALDGYRRLLQECDDRNIRAKAELGQAQIEFAFERRDRTLLALRKLSSQVDHRSLRSVEEQIKGIVNEYLATPFETEIRGAALAARRLATELHGKHREIEIGVAANLIDRGQFGAALDYLREIEAKRLPNDNRDIAELLARLRLESDGRAGKLLTEFERLRERQPEQAALLLDEQMPRFVGTRANARLLEARLQLASELPPEDPGNSQDLGKGRSNSERP